MCQGFANKARRSCQKHKRPRSLGRKRYHRRDRTWLIRSDINTSNHETLRKSKIPKGFPTILDTGHRCQMRYFDVCIFLHKRHWRWATRKDSGVTTCCGIVQRGDLEHISGEVLVMFAVSKGLQHHGIFWLALRRCRTSEKLGYVGGGLSGWWVDRVELIVYLSDF